MIYNNALEIIGRTPLVRLDKIVKKYNLDGEIYAKVEYYSPGLSKKDRIAKYIIEKAIRERKLKKGQTVINVPALSDAAPESYEYPHQKGFLDVEITFKDDDEFDKVYIKHFILNGGNYYGCR